MEATGWNINNNAVTYTRSNDYDESYYSSRSESGSSISSSSSSSSNSSDSGGDSQSKGEFISCWNAFTMGVNAAAAVGNDRMCCGGHGAHVIPIPMPPTVAPRPTALPIPLPPAPPPSGSCHCHHFPPLGPAAPLVIPMPYPLPISQPPPPRNPPPPPPQPSLPPIMTPTNCYINELFPHPMAASHPMVVQHPVCVPPHLPPAPPELPQPLDPPPIPELPLSMPRYMPPHSCPRRPHLAVRHTPQIHPPPSPHAFHHSNGNAAPLANPLGDETGDPYYSASRPSRFTASPLAEDGWQDCSTCDSPLIKLPAPPVPPLIPYCQPCGDRSCEPWRCHHYRHCDKVPIPPDPACRLPPPPPPLLPTSGRCPHQPICGTVERLENISADDDEFKTPPVLVYRCDRRGQSFWNKLSRWLFGAPSHHSLNTVNADKVQGNESLPGVFVDPSTNPDRVHHHLRRHAHFLGQQLRRDNLLFQKKQTATHVTINATPNQPAQIVIHSPSNHTALPNDS